jgi:hypothetical protein
MAIGALLWSIGAEGVMLAGCGAVQPNVVQAGIATVETAICVLNVSSKDQAAGKSAGDIVADCIVQCGTDAATIARVLDAHRAAEIRENIAILDGGK